MVKRTLPNRYINGKLFYTNWVFMKYIPRLLEEKLSAKLRGTKIILLLGARQVGKTTLIQHILRSKRGQLLNMDFAIDRKQILSAAAMDVDDVTRMFGANNLLVIDEAQRLNNIGRIVKGWYDMHIKLKIVLLGSSSDALINITASELVGRNEKLWLTPLLFREILDQQRWFNPKNSPKHIHKFFADQIKALLIERLVFGSYPEAYLTSDPRSYLQNLTGDYLLKDMFTSSVTRSPEDVRRLLVELAKEIGNFISIHQLATRTNLSRQTVTRYLDLLEGISVIFSIPSYATDSSKEVNRSRKYYFWDTGVRNELLREWTVSEDRSDIGPLWENWMIAEVAKLRLVYLRQEDLFCWQSRNGSTVDLIIKQGNTLHPFDFRLAPNKAGSSQAFENIYGLKSKTIHPGNVLEVLL